MPEFQAIDNILPVLTQRQRPSITMWNRLEGRPRREDFDRALKAEVRDPLWMLCKQWQMGEFIGDDAGSPIFAKVFIDTTRLTKYRPDEHDPRQFSEEMPLEAQVENRPIPFAVGDQYISLDLRLLMGRHWLKLVNKSAGNFDAEFIQAYSVEQPDPTTAADAQIAAHIEAYQQVNAFAGRVMDGYKLYQHLKANPANHSWDGTSIGATDQANIQPLEAKFISWFEKLYYQPQEGEGEAWKPKQLEYQFSCSAPAGNNEDKVYVADEYYHGRLDWYNLDVDPQQDSLDIPGNPAIPDPADTHIATFIPVEIAYEGMPHTRWWTFEDRKTNFGDIDPSTTDISKLLFMEFGLVYANDWFMLPFQLPAGSIAKVRGMTVTNVFGERIWVEAAGSGQDDDWQRWSMFTINTKGNNQEIADTSLLLLPTVPKIQESKPFEEAMLVRDEMANMVWGVETQIPLPSGESLHGREAGRELYEYYKRLVGAAPAPSIEFQAPIRYEVMNTVPENFIPFIPVHVENNNREIQLQRAAMPRIIEGDPNPPVKVRPRTTILRDGLDESPRKAYFLHEEEVPRAGVRVSQSFQRTRWYGGKVVTWVGVRKQTGRGESNSGLRFDSLRPVRRQTTVGS